MEESSDFSECSMLLFASFFLLSPLFFFALSLAKECEEEAEIEKLCSLSSHFLFRFLLCAPPSLLLLFAMLSSQAARAFGALTAAAGTTLASLSARGVVGASFSSSAIASAAADAPPSAPSTSTPGSHAPRVKPISLTLVLPDGRTRMPLRALPGSTLASVLLDHAAEIPESHSSLEGEYSHGVSPVAFSPEGRGAADAVVEVPAEVAAANPLHAGDDAARRALEELAEVVKPNSRLASSVVVDERMDGAVIALSKLRPWATL